MKPLSTDTAVVGMSCIFPGAGDLETYWQNIVGKKQAIKQAPDSRIPGLYYDPSSDGIDRHSVNKGGFIDEFLEFDPVEFGLVPNTVEYMEPDHLISLKLTARALSDAGLDDKRHSLEKTAIIVAKGNFGGLVARKFSQIVEGGQDFCSFLKTVFPSLGDDELERLKKSYQEQLGRPGPENIMGTTPNLVASLVANRFNFGGPAYTVDAACASSLLGIENGVRELQSGRCDTVVAGAVHLTQCPSMFSFFDTLGALSKSQQIRPFDKNADGVLTGEGCGYVVLKRLDDAIRDNHRIYAVIKSVSVSSDGANASIMSPSTIGQVKAIRRAWQMSGMDPCRLGYLEAHGTATSLGDRTELETLKEAFPDMAGGQKAVLGAVKAMIGHAMAAAGMAGFIKTAMALHKGVIPPTVNCENPVDALAQTAFRPSGEPLDWESSGLPMVAGVNAFGFGGANAHAILTHFVPERRPSAPLRSQSEVLMLARHSAEELISAIESGERDTGSGHYRIAVFNPSEDRLAMAGRIIKKGVVWHGRRDIWYSHQSLLEDRDAKIAFLFPGLDLPAMEELNVREIKDLAVFNGCEPPSALDTQDPHQQGRALEYFQLLIDAALKNSGIRPDAVAGHSLGEWTACSSVGMVDEDSVEEMNREIAKKEYPDVDARFLSVSCGLDELSPLLADESEVYISNDNCRSQVVLSARPDVAERLKEKLTGQGVVSHILPFATGYHSPFAEIYLEDARRRIDDILKIKPYDIPVWSSITTTKYPDAPEAIKKIHLDLIVQPVRFRQMIENMYRDGVRVFIQIGRGAVKGFVENILDGRPSVTVASGAAERATLDQLQRVLAALFVEGRDVDARAVNTPASKPVSRARQPSGLNSKLHVHYPFVDYGKIFDGTTLNRLWSRQNPENVSRSGGDAKLIDSLNQSLSRVREMQDEVRTSLGASAAGTRRERRYTAPTGSRRNIEKRVELSTDAFPYLIDHCPFRKISITGEFDREAEPVVAFTFFIDLVRDLFTAYFPDLWLSRITDARVHRFVWAAEPQVLTVTGEWESGDRIRFSVGDVFDAVGHIGSPEPGNLDGAPVESEPRHPPVVADQIYEQGYMFQGPAYQGIRRITAFSETHLETVIKGVSGKGALLDNMGQTVGLFYHFTGRSVRSFPVELEQVEFFEASLDDMGVFRCRCFNTGEDEDFLYSTVELTLEGVPWCRFTGWKTKKSDLDELGWRLMSRPEPETLSRRLADGVFVLESDRYRQTNSWFIMSNIYLSRAEISEYQSLETADRKTHLLGRIAAKDAVRDVLMKQSGRVYHPASCPIPSDASRRPERARPLQGGVHVSIACANGVAVAAAAPNGRPGVAIGGNGEQAVQTPLDESERALLRAYGDSIEDMSRVQTAKQAYANSLEEPAEAVRVSRVHGDSVVIGDVLIKTMQYRQWIVAWTV